MDADYPADGEVVRVIRASSLAVLAWVDQAGRPQATGVLVLTRGDLPVVALPFAQASLARALDGRGPVGRVGPVALALVERRGTAAGFRPLVFTARPRLTVDTTGDVYAGELVAEDLRRYPPARLLADSPILMREHWWWLPRLLVELPNPQTTWLGARDESSPGRQQLLATVDEGSPRLTVVTATPVPEAPRRLGIHVSGGQVPAAGPAVVFDQDASFPDLERWAEWRWRGILHPAESGRALLDVEEAPAAVGLPPTERLSQRLRRHRRLERACRDGLAEWERATGR